MSRNTDIVNKLTAGNKSEWLNEAKKREKYSYWYDFKFFIQLNWILFKKKFKKQHISNDKS